MFFPQVVVALAAAGHSLQQFKGSSPKASVIFCSSEGAIVVYDIAFDAKAERTWGKIVPQVAAFYTEKLLKKLAAELDIDAIPTASLIRSPLKSPAATVSAAPSLVVDQSPCIKVGKTVDDPKKRQRGEVTKLLPNGKVLVNWEDTGRVCNKPCNVSSLVVPPVLRDVPRPDRQGQVVHVVGGARQELIGQHGQVVRCTGDYSFVLLAGCGDSGDPIKIKNAFLAADAPREPTVPASTDSFKIPMSEFRTAMPALLKERSVKLIGCTAESFLEGWEKARKQLASKKSSPKRTRAGKKSK